MKRSMIVVECERNLDILYRVLSVLRKRYPTLENLRVKSLNEDFWELTAVVECPESDCDLVLRKLNTIIGVLSAQLYPLPQTMPEMVVPSPLMHPKMEVRR